MIDKVRDTLAAVTEDALAIAQLEAEVYFRKLAEDDRLSETVNTLRNVIATLNRDADDMVAQIKQRDRRIETLQKENEALKAGKGGDAQAAPGDEQLALFKKLEPLATRLPALVQAVKEGSAVSADDVSGLLEPLAEALGDMGFKPIGKAGGKVKFDSAKHRAVGKGARSVKAGDSVSVRYVGYTHAGDVVVKAHVTAL
jgi:hypothetical protein